MNPLTVAENTQDDHLRQMRLKAWQREQERIQYEQRKFDLEQELFRRSVNHQSPWIGMMKRMRRI